jgi:hypothetical protein
LARLNQIDGVQSSAANIDVQGGSRVRVALRPGANSSKVAEQVQRVLREEGEEGAVESVAGQPAAELEQQEWLDTTQLAEVAALEKAPSERLTRILLALLLAVLGVCLCLLGRRYLRHRQGAPAAPPLLPGT